MYRPTDGSQHSFLDFSQPIGFHMNPDNRWTKMADSIPWDESEIKYTGLFPSETGNMAKPLRMTLGTLIIQTKFQYSDRELVEQIAKNPYLQYFIGLPGYQEQPLSIPARWCCSASASPWRWSWRQTNPYSPEKMTARAAFHRFFQRRARSGKGTGEQGNPDP